ncbi:Acetylornithine/succinyldiaminopimelate/putrescine aminotransferase [bacterium A37T11]|nr:Acetylornithine/succinyldiaminopimelate/putrescine aminotransferase [bacterium A37T11]
MINSRQLFLLNTAQTSNFPRLIEISRSKGVYLYDPKGKRYIDLVSGFAVSNIGHRHPSVLKAIRNQLKRYLHVTVYGEFVLSPQVELAHQLVNILPDKLNSVYFVNSGAEATEGAMKLAKRYTGRKQIIAADKAYHGSTQGALSLIGNPSYHQAYAPLLPSIDFITFNQLADLEKISTETAAVILESVQGEAGIRVPSKAYMQAVRKRCDETGTLLILDEIQTGFGRTGQLFAFEHYGIVPDIILLAKGMGGGMPIGAFIANRNVMSVFKENPMLGHITTFGGHPVSCAAALANLQVILDEKLVQQVAGKEKLFRKHLNHPSIREIRGIGLMLAIQLDSFEQVEQVSKYCAEEGVMIDWFMHCDSALRLAPPLIISTRQIVSACRVIVKAINKFQPASLPHKH